VPKASRCQDCHMRKVAGYAANKSGIPFREDLALHDMTGGNTWMSRILASADPNWSGYDAYNFNILSGRKYAGASIHVSGLSGQGANLDRGAKRAEDQLKMAAVLSEVSNTSSALTIRVLNNTGHKLISGFPEGRRMFMNVKFYNADGSVISEVNRYDPLVTQSSPSGPAYVSGADIAADTRNEKLVWETEMKSTLTGEDKTFHFALATGRNKDNRIPPKGFDTAKMAERQAQPVWNGVDAPEYFSAAEYAGGYDDVTLAKPAGTASYSATLYYQTTSQEYITFLRDQIKGTANTLKGNGVAGDAPYLVQTDPFFSQLKGWGDAIWDLWVYNGGCAPVEMAKLGTEPTPETPMTAEAPTGLKGSYNKKTKAIGLTWNAPAEGANGYYIYRSRTAGGPYQRIGDVSTSEYSDSALSGTGDYYYVVTSYLVDKLGTEYESARSNEARVVVR
jgi:hypothetical protein